MGDFLRLMDGMDSAIQDVGSAVIEEVINFTKGRRGFLLKLLPPLGE